MMRLCFRRGIPFMISMTLGAVTPAVSAAGGIGWLGAWLLMVVLSVTLLSCIGGKYRAFFTGIATIVPFVYMFVRSVHYEMRTYGSASMFLREILREMLAYL